MGLTTFFEIAVNKSPKGETRQVKISFEQSSPNRLEHSGRTAGTDVDSSLDSRTADSY